MVSRPVIGGGFVWGIDPIAAQKKAAVTALRAHEWFAVNGPSDAPPLPLSHEDVEDYRGAGGLEGHRWVLRPVALYPDYDTQMHPSFDDFARGLMAMAVDRGLRDLEKDENLKRRFPPRPLAGMTSGAYWAPAKPMATYKLARAAA